MIKNKNYLTKEITDKIENYASGKSVFQTYLGVPFDLKDYNFNNVTYLFSPKPNVKDSLDGSFSIDAKQFPFILTNYCLMDEDFAPKGKNSIVIARFVDNSEWKNLSKDKYKEKKEKAQQEFIDYVEKITNIPLNKAEVIFSGTPKTMEFYSGNPFGSAIGLDHTIDQSTVNRFPQKSPIKNLFHVGHDTKPACGIGSVISSGIIAGNYLMKEK